MASLFVDVSADVSAAVNGLNALSNKLGTTTSAFQRAAPAALLFEAAAAGIAAGLVTSIKAAADFEHQMSGIFAVLNPAEIGPFSAALTELALKLGRDTVFTSREAAAGIEELIKAGVPAIDVLNGAGTAALALAAATGIPVAQAAQVAATAMNTFGVSATEMAHVTDILSGTANASATDIGQLQFALQAVGPVAAQMGLSLEDTAAAIGIFANNGLRGQDAGTSLKTMLLNLVPNTKKQTQEFKKLGLITEEGGNVFFDAAGHMRSLADIAEILKGALAGLTDEQRISTLQTLFGTDAVRAAAILYKTGGDSVNAFHAEVGKTSAAESARIRLDNLEGTLKNLGGSFERVQIQVGTIFLPVLRDLANRARGLVDAFGNLSPETQKLAVFVAIGVGAVLGLVGAFILLFPVVAALGPAFVALGAAFSFVLGPVGLIIGAIALIAAGLVYAFNTNEDFRNSVLGLWDAVQNNLFPAIQAAATAIGDALGPVFADLSQRFQAFVSEVGPQVVTFFQTAFPAALAATGTQLAALDPLFAAMRDFIGAAFDLQGSLASLGGTALLGLIQSDIAGLSELAAALGPLMPLFEQVGAGVNALAFGPLNLLAASIQPLTTFFRDLTVAINGAAGAIQTFKLPGFLTPGSGAGVPGAPGPQVTPAAFSLGGGAVGGAGGNVIINGPISLSGGIELQDFLLGMAETVRAAAGRVNAPPDNSAFPQLTPVFT